MIAQQGIRIARDIGIAVHTHPDDCFGVAFEFCTESWETRVWPETGLKLQPADYWRGQPGGLSGQKSYTIAVHDLEAATQFILRFFDTELAYDEARPHLAARARGFLVGGSYLELLAATGDGVLRDHLLRHGQGIRSAVYNVKDPEETRAWLKASGIEVVEGSYPGSIAVPAAANLGVMFEFVA